MKKLKIIGLIIIFVILTANSAFAGQTFDVKLVYEVEEGDALINIARKFGVAVDEIREENDLGNNDRIRIGDDLLIPRQYKYDIQPEEDFYSLHQPQMEFKELSIRNNTYKVKIASRKEAKNIDVSNLDTLSYQISAGDNLYDLAREFNTSISVIRELNDLAGSNVIRLGDQIELPINNLTSREVLAYEMTDDELDLLARLIHGEARGEPLTGQIAVGAVVLNRVLSSYFPNDLRDVIYQPRQFSPVSDGQIYLEANRTSYRAAREALNGKDPTRGALYFYNPDTANHIAWFQTREFVVRIGDHVFAR